MINISWDGKLSVGNEKIDNEHKVFIDLIRSCSQAIEKQEDANRLLEELTLYAKFHFFSEETLMIQSGYPGYESHRKEHVMLLARLSDKIHSYRSNTETGESLIDFIYQWFALHTTSVDTRLAQHLAFASPSPPGNHGKADLGN